MVYAILAIAVVLIGGGGWFIYRVYGAGKKTQQADTLKAGSQARERQNESYDKNRGSLAERIGIRVRDRDDRET